MKKVVSWLLFILTILIFSYDIYGTVSGAIDIKNQFAVIEASGGSGVDYWGVGADIFIFLIAFITIIGMGFAVASWLLAENRVVRKISLAILILFVPVIVICGALAYM